MSNKKISDLDAAAALDGTETAPVVQAGATVKATATAIANEADDLAASVVTSGTFADGRISASSVTQHAPSQAEHDALDDRVAVLLGLSVR